MGEVSGLARIGVCLTAPGSSRGPLQDAIGGLPREVGKRGLSVHRIDQRVQLGFDGPWVHGGVVHDPEERTNSLEWIAASGQSVEISQRLGKRERVILEAPAQPPSLRAPI